MAPTVKNIFADHGEPGDREYFSTLFENSAGKVDRIVSYSYRSPPDFWYDQAEDEWVMIVRGSAALEFFGSEIVEMTEGDYLIIPRHTRHRVARTSENTLWLAIHLR
jgi:cupin 2 domain-containing protein